MQLCMGVKPTPAFPRRALTLCMQHRMGISPSDMPKSARPISARPYPACESPASGTYMARPQSMSLGVRSDVRHTLAAFTSRWKHLGAGPAIYRSPSQRMPLNSRDEAGCKTRGITWRAIYVLVLAWLRPRTAKNNTGQEIAKGKRG